MLKLIGVSAKGKKQWVGKSKKKILVGCIHNGNLNLDKRQSLVRGGSISYEESTSSSKESKGNRFFEDSLKVKRECSKNQIVSGGDGLFGGPPKPKKASFFNISNSPYDFQIKDNGIELCVDLGLVEVSSSKVLPHNHLKPIIEEGDPLEAEDEETSASSEDGKSIVNSSLKESLVKKTGAVEEQRDKEVVLVQNSEVVEKEAEISKVRVLGSAYSEELVLATVAVEEDTSTSEIRIPNSASKKKGKFSNESINNHRMKTRNFGIIEEEVSKVMEVGNMLGFDFTGIEQEMSDVIASREVEDLARMENQEGL